MAFDDTPRGNAASVIREHAQAFKAEYPGLNAGSYLNDRAKGMLRTLMVACGVAPRVVALANGADLISVYRVALASPDAAIRTAEKVSARLSPPVEYVPAPGLPAPASFDPDEARAMVQAAVSALDVPGMIEDALKSQRATRLEYVPAPDAPPIPLGLTHKQAARVIRYLSRKRNVYLFGPAGSGKTTLAEQLAKAFGVRAYYAAKVENEFQLMGFVNGGGYVTTQFRLAYEFGGVFLFDEFDASSASAVVALNMALANGRCAFPDRTVDRHPDFYCVAAGNTKLAGATQQYQGRNPLDAASVNRFVGVEFDYDEELEMEIAPNKDWCTYVQAVRAAIRERGLDVLCTPRATLDGAELIDSGDTWSEAAFATIYWALDDATADTLREAAAYAFKGH
jgi:hypothetical protein